VEVVDLAFTAVTDKGLQRLAAHAESLQLLILAQMQNNIWSCGLYSDAGLLAFHAARPTVTVTLASV
jgi:hypothetical protein